MVTHVAVVATQVNAPVRQWKDKGRGQVAAELGCIGQVQPLVGSCGKLILVKILQAQGHGQVGQGQGIDLKIQSRHFCLTLVGGELAQAAACLLVSLHILDFGEEERGVDPQP